jgi:predicted small secreted protein
MAVCAEGDTEMKKILMALALSSGLFVAACNTVEGAGRDVQSVGECADGKKGNC